MAGFYTIGPKWYRVAIADAVRDGLVAVRFIVSSTDLFPAVSSESRSSLELVRVLLVYPSALRESDVQQRRDYTSRYR